MMYHDEHWWTLMSHRIWVAILLGHQLWKRGLFGFSLASSSAKRRSFFHVERATMNPFQTRPGFRTAGAWSKQPTSCDGRFLGENRGCGTWWYVAICRDMSQYVTMTWLSRKPLQQDPAGSVLQHAIAEESERVWKIWDILRFAEIWLSITEPGLSPWFGSNASHCRTMWWPLKQARNQVEIRDETLTAQLFHNEALNIWIRINSREIGQIQPSNSGWHGNSFGIVIAVSRKSKNKRWNKQCRLAHYSSVSTCFNMFQLFGLHSRLLFCISSPHSAIHCIPTTTTAMVTLVNAVLGTMKVWKHVDETPAASRSNRLWFQHFVIISW